MHAPFRLRVKGEEDGLQLAGAGGRLKAHGQPPQEAVDGLLVLHAQHRPGRAGHAQVSDEAQSPVQHLAVGGGHMGVGPPKGLHPAVQIVGHGPLFAGGLCVEVHQAQVGVQVAQKPVRHGEGVVEVGVHLAPADEVHHSHAQATRPFVDSQSPAGDPAGVVGRPQEPGHIVQQVLDLECD